MRIIITFLVVVSFIIHALFLVNLDNNAFFLAHSTVLTILIMQHFMEDVI